MNHMMNYYSIILNLFLRVLNETENTYYVKEKENTYYVNNM